MSEVFREVSFSYDGQEYTIVPSLALLRRIKAKGINCLALATQCMNGGADPLDLAVAHNVFMSAAGVSLSEEDSYAFIVGASSDMISFQIGFVEAVLPSIDLGKKPAPRVAKAGGAKAKRAKKAT